MHVVEKSSWVGLSVYSFFTGDFKRRNGNLMNCEIFNFLAFECALHVNVGFLEIESYDKIVMQISVNTGRSFLDIK